MRAHNKAYGRDLQFLRRIHADGTSEPIQEADYLHDTLLTLTCLSISQGTYIAHGFSTYVVKMKPTAHTPKNNWEMATALRDGTPCRVNRKYVRDVLEALDYFKLKAEIEMDGDTVTITPKP
jgi:hypothetical protein